ncbi:hypothetical protein SAMN05661093_11259 [Kibdelosporangium aridum]|uniref:Uncharacterized protein n=1 Tax=Kibdelosporangium aridum TaxID=2030 RepID=A0A1W2G0A5_KIBAR|nr:hypothetical protein SAMN05661093_11259 [Kibdelosporangium aridum]
MIRLRRWISAMSSYPARRAEKPSPSSAKPMLGWGILLGGQACRLLAQFPSLRVIAQFERDPPEPAQVPGHGGPQFQLFGKVQDFSTQAGGLLMISGHLGQSGEPFGRLQQTPPVAKQSEQLGAALSVAFQRDRVRSGLGQFRPCCQRCRRPPLVTGPVEDVQRLRQQSLGVVHVVDPGLGEGQEPQGPGLRAGVGDAAALVKYSFPAAGPVDRIAPAAT